VVLPLPLFSPRRSPHSFLWKPFKENIFTITIYQFSSPPLLPLLLPPCARSLPQLLVPRHCIPIKHVAHRKRMAKEGTKKQALGWTASVFDEADLKKVNKEGFLAESMEIVFPSTEVIPAPPPGFRVMFLDFLLHGFSLPAHEFLHGLLFVYGVQLHQLTPNSLLHIACLITLCEAFLGVNPH
jgi:hypothetical protein